MKKKMLKERKPIEVIVKVETLKNGYSLDVDGKEYLYFDVVELAKGLILHAGLGRTSPTTKFGRDSLLRAIGNGSAEKKLQQEINKLQNEVFTLQNKLHGYNKRGIKVKRCCASCKNKEIDNFGNRHCTKGFESCETCRSWRMRDELRNAGTPFGVIKTKEYLHYVLDIRDRETNSTCYVKRGPQRDINEIRKEYCATQKKISSIKNL